MSRKVLIIGGAGYIGTVLCDYLFNHNYSVSSFDNFLYRNCTSNKVIETILKECFGKRVFDYQSLYVEDI